MKALKTLISKLLFHNKIMLPETDTTRCPDVYVLAAYLGRKLESSCIIEIGCGKASRLMDFSSEFKIVGIDNKDTVDFCAENYKNGQWIEWCPEKISLEKDVLQKSIIICSDVIQHLANPSILLKIIKKWMSDAAICLITTPELDFSENSTKSSAQHEWSFEEFGKLVESAGLKISYSGLTINNSQDLAKKTSVIILENLSSPDISTAPESFKVVAFMTAFNEGDIIIPSLSYLISQGIGVYLIDNWSTDNTYQDAKEFLGRGLIGIERFPSEGPSQYYEWKRLLCRVEELTSLTPADWFIHHDVDEIRESPITQVKLKDMIYHLDRTGFNALDHTCIVFVPTDDGFVSGSDFKKHFSYFEFGERSGHFQQVKAWKNLKKPITLAETGGHDVNFEGRRIYPYKFLLRHYPVRSQAHGLKKVFQERKQRFCPQERATMGWHGHYDPIIEGHSFIKKPEELQEFYDKNFYSEFLVERLSGIGILRSKT